MSFPGAVATFDPTFPARQSIRQFVLDAIAAALKAKPTHDILQQQARRFDALTTGQQDAWNVAASRYRSRPTLGQSGSLTGLQLFTKINCTLAQLGQTLVDMPPRNPVFPERAPRSLVITRPISAGIRRSHS